MKEEEKMVKEDKYALPHLLHCTCHVRVLVDVRLYIYVIIMPDDVIRG